ncbi:hypothetical protein L6452_44757 [Arctium lappa]|nr:hypothetical protein L6452_44757 [Arctium lappa]
MDGVTEDVMAMEKDLTQISYVMIRIASWNIRGLNSLIKQKEVKNLVYMNGVSLCIVLETHVQGNMLHDVCSRTFPRWSWLSNHACSAYGTRIIIAWDVRMMDVMLLYVHSQYMHVEVCVHDLAHIRLAFQQACMDEEVALRQRAKIHWLNEGYSNTKFFHQVVREKRHANFIHTVCDSGGIMCMATMCPTPLSIFRRFLGTKDAMISTAMDDVEFSSKLSLAERIDDWLVRFPLLMTYPLPNLNNDRDVVYWKGAQNALMPFTMNSAWITLDGPYAMVTWAKMRERWKKTQRGVNFLGSDSLCEFV